MKKFTKEISALLVTVTDGHIAEREKEEFSF